MARIRILSPQTANKIAAGEVVERPASVVKELVENSLDANATQIEVSIESGGLQSLEIRDNGCGMTRDDAVLAFERHATSKVAEDEDLYRITTLGFRGEALPSIAAVSKLELTTRISSELAGTRVVLAGGEVQEVSVSGCPVGTMVVVRDLFFNTPARRKFLGSAQAEARRIMEVFRMLALSHTDVAFKLVRDNKHIIATTGSGKLDEVVAEFFGAEYSKKMLVVKYNLGDYRVEGLVGDVNLTYHNRTRQYTFVNGRSISDGTICHALEQVFRNRIPSGRFPVAFLYLEVPPDQVDVNVHPAKHEVRFANKRQVHRLITLAVQEALTKREADLTRSLLHRGTSMVQEQSLPYTSSELPLHSHHAGAVSSGNLDTLSVGSRLTSPIAEPDLPLKQVVVLGQCHNSYIVAQTRDGMIIIDQHAAHERIIYADLQRQAEQQDQHIQQLVVPITVDLPLLTHQRQSELVSTLKEIGFQIEPFGKTTFIVRAVPDFVAASLGREGVQGFLESFLDEASEIERMQNAVLQQLSCRAAVKANQPLNRNEMLELIGKLIKTPHWRTCPHGRPTVWSISIAELEKRFMR